jgi:parallel beta-helix repeat protein
VEKAISLIGENPEDTIIDAQWTLYAVLVQADNVVVRNFTLSNSSTTAFTFYEGGGIYLHSSQGCDVEDCIVINNDHGINVYNSSHTHISNNLVRGNSMGITFWEFSSNNLIQGNWLMGNSHYGVGIILGPSSANTTIVQNYFVNDLLGVGSIDPGSLVGSASGNVFQNNFMRDPHIIISYNLGDGIPQPHISWSNGSQGNFYKNYSGADADRDGVGDTPYIIDQYNTDNYPLIRPYKWLQGDVNYDTVVNIIDVSIIAKVFGSSMGDALWNARCDLNDDETINILDISSAALQFGEKMSWHPT